MKPAEFEGAETRLISHRAGFADVDQTGEQFLHLFGLPNFFFHVTTAHDILRNQGVVNTRRDGKNIYYSVASADTLEILGLLYRLYCPQPDGETNT